MSDAVRYEVAKGVATLTLDRPDNRNALSIELLNDLDDQLDRATGDEAVRVIILTNAGSTFCAGADLKGSRGEESRHDLVDVLTRMLDGPKPVIGRIAGHCMGGGVGLAAACDISVAADDARFGFTEVRLGVAPAMISVVCLPKLRRGDAAELFLTGEVISAARAAEVGIMNHAVPADQLDGAVEEIVGKVVRGGPKGLAAAKELIRRVPDLDRTEAFAWTAKLSAELFATDEAAAGIAAFRSKSDAPWVPSD